MLSDWEQQRLREIERGLQDDYPHLVGPQRLRRRTRLRRYAAGAVIGGAGAGLAVARAWTGLILVALCVAVVLMAVALDRHQRPWP